MTTEIINTLKERGSKYGTIEQNAIVTQQLMEVLKHGTNYGRLSFVHIECLHMIMHKISRMVNGDGMYADNAHDIAGYATLLEKWMEEKNADCQ